MPFGKGDKPRFSMAESFFFTLFIEQLDIFEAVELGELLAVFPVGQLVEAFQRHVGCLEGHESLGFLVFDVLPAFDGEEEVFGKALLDDFLPFLGFPGGSLLRFQDRATEGSLPWLRPLAGPALLEQAGLAQAGPAAAFVPGPRSSLRG